MPNGAFPVGTSETHGEPPDEVAAPEGSVRAPLPTSFAEERRRAAEATLSSLAGVRAVRVSLAPDGEIDGVLALADDDFLPDERKQQIRSALLAEHGLDVDPRRISLAEVFGSRPARERAVPRPVGGGGRVKLRQIAYEQEGFSIVAHVEVEWGGSTFRGVSREADTAAGRTRAAARAALKALEQLAEQRVAFMLEGLDELRTFDRRVMVASVRALFDGGRLQLVGCARLEHDPRHTAAHAVLAAVNRSLSRLVERAARESDDGFGPAVAGRDGGRPRSHYALHGE